MIRDREPGEDDGDDPGPTDADFLQPASAGPVAVPLTGCADSDAEAEGQDARSTPKPWGPMLPFAEYDLPGFPIGALPSVQREFVQAVAEDTQTPPDFPAMLSLAVVATCVQGRAVVQVTPSYSEPLSIFAVVIAESGERKSAVVKHVAAPLYAWEDEAVEALRVQVESARSDRRLLEQRQAATEKRAATAKNAGERSSAKEEIRGISEELAKMPPLPEYPRLLADDVTPEALARLMAAHDERMGALGAEGGIFETMAGRYNNGVSNLDVFLKGHAGDPIRVDRRNAPPVAMRRPALTIGLAVQPDVVGGLASKDGFRGRGLIARFLFARPTSLVGSRRIRTEPVPERAAHAYHGVIKCLLNREIDRVRDRLQGKAVPEIERLSLTPAAEAARIAFAGRIEPRLGPNGDLRPVADWGSKLTGAAVRIAGLLFAITCAEERRRVAGAIPEAAMASAIQIAEYLVPHALAAVGEMGADPEVDAARAAWVRIRAYGASTFTERELFNRLRGQTRFKKMAAVKAALSSLGDRNLVRQAPGTVRQGPGQPASPTWEVNPLGGLSTANSHNPQNSAERSNSADSADSAVEVAA